MQWLLKAHVVSIDYFLVYYNPFNPELSLNCVIAISENSISAENFDKPKGQFYCYFSLIGIDLNTNNYSAIFIAKYYK